RRGGARGVGGGAAQGHPGRRREWLRASEYGIVTATGCDQAWAVDMGYTTEFEGEFACYHPENETVGAVLKARRHGDLAALAPLADWLLDHDDPRGEAVAKLAKKSPKSLRPLWRLFGLKRAHAKYLSAFCETRRVKRDAGKAKLIPDP